MGNSCCINKIKK